MNLTPPISSTAASPPESPPTARLALGVGKIAFELAALGLQRFDAAEHLGNRSLELVGQSLGDGGLLQQVAPRGLPGQGLDAPDAGGDARLRYDLEQGDVAGARHMGAAAQLDRIVALALQRRDRG